MDKKPLSTKDKILHLLKKEATLTVNELTDRLNITHMAVRKHLTILEKDGFIVAKELRQPMGRPLLRYFLAAKSESYFPKNYEGISLEFLHDIKELHGEESIYHLFKKREERLINEYSLRTNEKDHASKMQEIAKIQNEKGYMADLNQIDENTFELVEYNCPILEVAKEFKMACRCETDMLKNVLGTEQVHRICCRTDGDNHCRFSISF